MSKRKLLLAVVAVFAVLLLVGLPYAWLSTSSSLKNAEDSALQILRNVAGDWSVDTFCANATDECRNAQSREQLAAFLQDVGSKCGPLVSANKKAWQYFVGVGAMGTTCVFVFDCDFEKARCDVTVQVRKIDGQWKLQGFRVDSNTMILKNSGP